MNFSLASKLLLLASSALQALNVSAHQCAACVGYKGCTIGDSKCRCKANDTKCKKKKEDCSPGKPNWGCHADEECEVGTWDSGNPKTWGTCKHTEAECVPFAGGDRAVAALTGGDFAGAGGTVALTSNPDGSFLMSLDGVGLGIKCQSDNTGCDCGSMRGTCKAIIVDGTSCDDITGKNGIAWLPFVVTDKGFSNDATRVFDGGELATNLGRAVVVTHSTNWNDEVIMGCGLLEAAAGGVDRNTFLRAEMGAYPGYVAAVEVIGAVTVAYRADGTFKFEYDLAGLEASCERCGIHIHSGTSCNTHEEVKGPGWNSDLVLDLWTADDGAAYGTDESGAAKGYFNMYNGFSMGKNQGRAVVIHDGGGVRVGCGVLELVVA